MPWQTIGAFLRIATNTKLPGDRYSSAEACDIVESWLAVPSLIFLQPTLATTDRDFVRFPGLRWLNPIAP